MIKTHFRLTNILAGIGYHPTTDKGDSLHRSASSQITDKLSNSEHGVRY